MIGTAVIALAVGMPAPQAQDQAFLAILADTKVGRMAGMPPMDLSGLPPGIKLPPEAMMFSGQAARALQVRLWSPGIAPDGATAFVTPPAGLKQGNRLDLALYRPKGDKEEGGARGFEPDADPNFTIKIYWGSSTTVREGQPKVIRWTDIGPEARQAMRARAKEMNQGSSYFYKPNWTTGYWPTNKQQGVIDSAASLVGKYALTTSYTGNVEIEAPANVEFLAPILMSAPNLDNKVDLKKSMGFRWNAIPNALGLNAFIMGMEGKSTMTLWSSSEVYVEGIMGDTDFLQMAEVRQRVAQTEFMAGDRTSVDVPNGIFENADFVMMTMAGFGPGAALETAQPLPRIQTKTTLMIMLGGKKVDF